MNRPSFDSVKAFFIHNIDFILLMGLSFALIFYKIFSMPLIDGDSAFYSKIAKNVVESGNWLTFRYLDPKDIIDKPLLAFWPAAICFKLFGVTHFAASVWHSLLSLATVALVFFIGKELFGRRAGFYSGLIMMTSLQFFYQTRLPMQDMGLAFFISLSLFCFYLFMKNKKILLYYLFVLFAAVSVLFKGPVSIALIAPVIIVYLLVQRKLPFDSKREWLLHGCGGLLLFLVVAGGWFLHQYITWGQPFLDKYWFRNVGRFFRSIDVETETKRDFYALFIWVLATFLPWSGFLYPGIYYLFKLRKKEYKAEIDFLLVWFFVVIGFFSVSGNRKIIRYMLPFFPAISIMMGKVWNDILAAGSVFPKRIIKTSLAITAVITLPLLAVIIFATMAKFPEESIAYLPIFIPFITALGISLVAFLVLAFAGRLKPAFYALICLMAISFLIFIHQGAEHFPKASPYPVFSQKINALSDEQARVGALGEGYNSYVVFYVDKEVKPIRDLSEAKEFLSAPGRAFIIIEGAETKDKLIKDRKAYILNSSNNRYLISNRP